VVGRRIARSLVYAGIIGAVLGLSKIHARYIADPPYDFTGSFRFAWAIAFIGMLGVAAYGVGLPDLPRSIRSAFGSAIAAAVGPALGISALQLVAGDALLPRFVVFGSPLLLVPWYLLCTALAMGGRLRAEDREQVVLVADPGEAELLRHDLESDPERPAVVAAVVSPADVAASGAQGKALIEAAMKHHASVVVLNRDALADESAVAQAAALHERGFRIRTMSLFYEQWLGKLPLSELERVSLLFDIGEVHRSRYGRLKRMLDVVVAAVGLVFFALCVPFVLLGNLFMNKGSLFYIQPRIGKNGDVFQILKFRTMRAAVEGEDGATVWTAEHDPRITPFGKILRTSHLDELPQMVNIMRGELSIVGPRPEQPQYVAELAEKLPFYELRHLVRPGLTGWAQVKYGYASDETDAMEKLQYEFFYLRHQTLSMDLRIIGRTLRSVLGRGGR
jgi:lipopolysaccharide/colanic/teichoic acid biosynthesis glycosyltransferase